LSQGAQIETKRKPRKATRETRRGKLRRPVTSQKVRGREKQAIQARALAAAEARRRGIGRTAQKVTAQRNAPRTGEDATQPYKRNADGETDLPALAATAPGTAAEGPPSASPVRTRMPLSSPRREEDG